MGFRTFLDKYTVVALHVCFWLVYLSYRVYDIQEYIGVRRALVYVSLPMGFALVASYIHYFFILPDWLTTKKSAPYLLKLLALLVVVTTLRILLENQVFPSITPDTDYYKTLKVSRVISTVWDTLAFIVFTGMIRFTVNWFVLENRKKQLENEKLAAELNYLKAQINPHFLFNTLHNLNYLVYSKSENATEVIIKLSNIMRYMIYEANKNEVLLQKEITYMNDYIALESLRLNQSFKLDFNIEGNTQDALVAPLVLITFLENAFKHGVSDQEENCWIKANLSVTADQIRFTVNNKKLDKTPERERSGFGLENVTKRLQLIYPERHSIRIDNRANTFHIDLTITR
jgi:LytS/YehU family sensor histidine kinase